MIPGLGRFFQHEKILKTVSLSGLILCALLIGAIAALTFIADAQAVPSQNRDPFSRSLRDYDMLAPDPEADPESLDRSLAKLEKKSESPGSWLSTLKRRRDLARRDSRFIPAYQEAARKAAAAFPYSQPLAALAAATHNRGSPLTAKTREALKKYLPLLSETSLSPLVLGIHILLGDLADPAAVPPRLEDLVSAALPLLREDMALEETEALEGNMALLAILGGDTRSAEAHIIRASAEANSPDFLGFTAEYFYDYGDPLRAAGIFARLAGSGGNNADEFLGREADALWLAGYTDAARELWTILVSPRADLSAETVPPAPALDARALYNLAATAASPDEAASLLERLLAETQDRREGSWKFGLLRYSRLSGAAESLAVLKDGSGNRDPLLDLELLRRRAEIWPHDRIPGEIWMLLGLHPDEENLYHWAAWYFNYQRKFDETARLIQTAERRNPGASWIKLHKALGLIGEGRLDAGEELLKAAAAETPLWQIPANLGRILEARRSPAAALIQYETAVEIMNGLRPETPPAKEEARLQVRIALCLIALNRREDGRRALEYALDLDPDNLGARLELSRLDKRTDS
jgi:tetratricopeptide (TPR) repeat protein